MNLAKKTSITFCDENRDEYEIDIFTNLFDSKKVFEKIIQKANDNGNGANRQYAF